MFWTTNTSSIPIFLCNELALYYWKIIRARDSIGPYIIVGYSYSGVIVYAMGKIAEVEKYNVQSLVLLEGTPFPAKSRAEDATIYLHQAYGNVLLEHPVLCHELASVYNFNMSLCIPKEHHPLVTPAVVFKTAFWTLDVPTMSLYFKSWKESLLPGTHYSILQRPDVQIVADKINEEIVAKREMHA